MSTDYHATPVFSDPVVIPDDGDFAMMSVLGAALENLANRTAYLKALTAFGIINVITSGADGSGGVLDSTTNSFYSVAGNHWADVTTRIGDVLLIFFRASVYSSGTADSFVKLYVTDDLDGTPVTADYPGSEMRNNTTSPIGGQRATHAVHQVAKSGHTQIAHMIKSSGGNTAAISGPWSITVVHLRPAP